LGYESSLEAWATVLWAALRSACPLPPGAPPDPPPGAPPPPPPLRLRVEVVRDAAPPLPPPPPGEQDSDAEVAACVAAAAALDALLAPAPPAEGAGVAPRFSAARPCLAHVTLNERITAEAHPQA
jgi:hypothetical protein